VSQCYIFNWLLFDPEDVATQKNLELITAAVAHTYLNIIIMLCNLLLNSVHFFIIVARIKFINFNHLPRIETIAD